MPFQYFFSSVIWAVILAGKFFFGVFQNPKDLRHSGKIIFLASIFNDILENFFSHSNIIIILIIKTKNDINFLKIVHFQNNALNYLTPK